MHNKIDLSYTGRRKQASPRPLYGRGRVNIKLPNFQIYFFVRRESHKVQFLEVSHLPPFSPTFCDCNTAIQKKCP